MHFDAPSEKNAVALRKEQFPTCFFTVVITCGRQKPQYDTKL